MTAVPEKLKRDWIPPDERTSEQQLLTADFASQVGTFADRGTYVDTPERVLFAELEAEATGSVVPRIWQQTGSCVGAAAFHAYLRAMVGDILHRGDQESVESICFLLPYGYGRKLARMNGRGEGSFGAAQAKAVEQFGYLKIYHPKLPRPRSIIDGWITYEGRDEYNWSHSYYWPVSFDELAV